MAATCQILCISKNDRYNPNDRITHIGAVDSDGKHWKLTLLEAIEGIDADKWRFYVNVKGNRVWVVAAVSQFGSQFLKTENDGDEPNNLLNLPECP
jgi:hypothetical protein